MQTVFKHRGRSTNPTHSSWFAKENWAAIITWVAFSYIQINIAVHSYGLKSWQTPLIVVSLVLFIGLFLNSQRELSTQRQWLQLGSMWLVLALNAALIEDGFTPGLAVLWVALLPWFISERWLYWMVIPALAPHAVVSMLDQPNRGDFLLLLTCGTFQFFAIFAMSKARSESLAREDLAVTHQQLLDAQGKLAEQAADTERLRIARDLHDSLGHHLTALVIQLQVAEYQADTTHRPQLQHCHQLAKQLLQDIRHSVSQLREPQKPHLASQCRALAQNFPQLKLQCNINSDLQLDPLSTALLFRVCQEALTNSIRHADATEATIEVWRHQSKINLRYQDNGHCTVWPLAEGNGLQGMRERIEDADGKLLLSKPKQSLQIDVELTEVAA
ncbi:MAG: sensor histidine kinase [Gammaproteobacteria bacterium]|nr:sensor histidine kinase [Gammaproteobacteria bacterium]